MDNLIRDTSASGDSHPDLVLLRRWALAQLPHLTMTTVSISASSWDAWSRHWGQTDADRPEEITSDADIVADSVEDLGEWVYPGEDRYPADTTGMDVEPDGEIRLPLSAVATAAAMLTGHTTRFCAQSYGGDPSGSACRARPRAAAGSRAAHSGMPPTWRVCGGALGGRE